MNNEQQRILREIAWSLAILSDAQRIQLARYHQRLLHDQSRLLDIGTILQLYEDVIREGGMKDENQLSAGA
jgi:hypothetical protein